MNIELEEIIVYQEGRRVTLETDEHAQLLEEARFSGRSFVKTIFLDLKYLISNNRDLTIFGLG